MYDSIHEIFCIIRNNRKCVFFSLYNQQKSKAQQKFPAWKIDSSGILRDIPIQGNILNKLGLRHWVIFFPFIKMERGLKQNWQRNQRLENVCLSGFNYLLNEHCLGIPK